MNSISTISKYCFALLIFLSTANANANDTDPIAIVNGVEIPKDYFEMLVKSQTSQSQQQDTPQFRNDLLEVVITREILAQEALKRQLDLNREYQLQMATTKEQLLINMLFKQLVDESDPTEDQKRTEYARLKKENAKLEEKEYLVRHILVDDIETANSIIEKLNSGSEFSDLAKEFSTDTSTKDSGGDLGWSSPNRFVKPFSDRMVQLAKGEVSATPVLSNYGYHVIQVTDIRASDFPPYEDIQDQIKKELVGKARDDFITKLRDQSTIEKLNPQN
jgi:peptidyl-prolyl cis-trans isomerase C